MFIRLLNDRGMNEDELSFLELKIDSQKGSF